MMNVLDIGTGTGLLSLMYAQKNNTAIIDAVEIEQGTAEQAEENFRNSPWKDRLQLINADIQDLAAAKKYDLVICNPPFFENDLLSIEENKNIAMHDTGLSLAQLIVVIKSHMNADGSFAVLLPYHRVKYFENLAEENELYPVRKILVRQTPAHNFFRGILFFNKKKAGTCVVNELTIKNDKQDYTDECKDLLKDYYLYL